MAVKIKQIPKEERPREKAVRNGIGSLSNSELIALLIQSGTKEDSAITLSLRLISHFGSLNALFNSSYEELTKIKGIKMAKATLILSINELVKRLIDNKLYSDLVFNHPSEISSYFEPILRNEKQEKFIVVFLDTKNKLIKYDVLFIGGINSTLVDITLIFKKAIELAASKIICLHNHPSGDTTPSDNDIIISKKIHKTGEFLNIFLLDHIIIGKGQYTSLKQLSYF